MKMTKGIFLLFVVLGTVFSFTTVTNAALTLTAGNQVTTTPNVATAVTGFQIVGPATDTTPVKLRATNGTLSLSVVSGVTMSGNNTGTVSLSGTVANLNTALATLKYTRANVGTDTLEVSLVNAGEVFFSDNNHLYKFVSGSYSWSAAKTAAEGQTLYGAQGYLATITSLEENNFVYTRISGNGWLGATDAETEKNWKWATGPEAGTVFFLENGDGGGGSAISGQYHGWADGEPNDAGGEDCGYMYASQGGEWNDFPCATGQGYVAEFGAPGNMPVVVAANISIVTADVPAITSLTPANSATLVSPTTNLVLGFSKTVTVGTGEILIKKSSDNSTVAAIDVTSGLVTGGGTNIITINPTESLPEGVRLYVTVPNTAFKDSGNNFFEGIALATTWTFTTNDVTAPEIIDPVAIATDTSVTITWNTNEAASTKLVYSTDDSFGVSTSETNTNPRVTSHEVTLTGLVSCTAYSFKVQSKDSYANNGVSDHLSFMTTGCVGGADPTTVRVNPVDTTVPSTATLQENNREFTVETPADFTSESNVVIQIKSLPSAPVLTTIGKPTNKLLSAAVVVFDVTALINSTTVLDSFDVPVTVSYKYTDADIAGLKESSLTMQHYANGAWSTLTDCAVNTSANTVTCHAPHFSIFAIFGTPANTGGVSGSSVQARVNNLVATGNPAAAESLKKEYPAAFQVTPTTPSTTIQPGKKLCAVNQLLTQNLKAGARNGKTHSFTKGVVTEVKILQAHMNRLGFNAGVVDGILGPITDGAIKRMQTYLGTKADGLVGPLTRALINNSCGEAGL